MAANIQLVDMKDDPELLKIEASVSKFVRSMQKLVDIESLSVQESKSHKSGRRRLYEMKIHLSTPMHFFVSSSTGWSPLDCIESGLDNIEKEVKKFIGKRRDISRSEARDARGK